MDAGNFELAVQTYPTLAILFHKEAKGGSLVRKWEEVSRLGGVGE